MKEFVKKENDYIYYKVIREMLVYKFKETKSYWNVFYKTNPIWVNCFGKIPRANGDADIDLYLKDKRVKCELDLDATCEYWNNKIGKWIR